MRKVLLTALMAVSFGIAQAKPKKASAGAQPADTQPSTVQSADAQSADAQSADSTGYQSSFYEGIPFVDDLIQYAKRHLSSRYRSGGSSPRGFDCSGFTRFCFKQFGILLPHSSHAQGSVGTEIEKESAKPGDLIFFKGQSSGSSRIGHVGMIVEVVGDRIKFIHSAWNGGVRYDWLHASYYQRRFMGVRRVLATV